MGIPGRTRTLVPDAVGLRLRPIILYRNAIDAAQEAAQVAEIDLQAAVQVVGSCRRLGVPGESRDRGSRRSSAQPETLDIIGNQWRDVRAAVQFRVAGVHSARFAVIATRRWTSDTIPVLADRNRRKRRNSKEKRQVEK